MGVRAVTQREDGDLIALQQLFDHDRLAEGTGCGESDVELLLVVADEDALPCGQAVGLDHARWSSDRERLCGGDAGVTHQLLRERLRALDPRRLPTWAEDEYASMSQLVCDPGDQRCVGPDHHEVDVE